MAIDAYMWFQNYDGSYLESESQVDFSQDPQKTVLHYPPNNNIFEIEDYAFDVEQTLNIGSQSSGAGAGKITFNPFSITRKIDKASPTLFQMSCSGKAFQTVVLLLRKAAGGATGAVGFLTFTFKLVAIKTISWAYAPEEPREKVSFEYGGLVIEYFQQKPDGTIGVAVLGGWNRIKNIADTNIPTILR
jgi:type VI secretion system secreted protein Hcp